MSMKEPYDFSGKENSDQALSKIQTGLKFHAPCAVKS